MADEVPGGAEWIAELPRLAAECIEQWSLEPEEAIDAAFSLVVPAGDVVLKMNPPREESEHEAEALARWNGRGAARLLARDDQRRALLIERLRPGTQLWWLPDRKATEIAAGVLEQLWIPAGKPFRRLEDVAATWVEFLPAHWESLGRPYERRLLDEAVDFLREAGPTQRESVLLHQDLHGGNVLLSARGWLAIDAKPLVGEREFDVASLLRDRRPTTRRVMLRRLNYLVDRLRLDRKRACGWGIAHALAWNGSPEMIDAARFLSASKPL
jgi:streptomycin 6-kinase